MAERKLKSQDQNIIEILSTKPSMARIFFTKEKKLLVHDPCREEPIID